MNFEVFAIVMGAVLLATLSIFAVLIYQAINVTSSLAGTATRASDRERRDLLHMIQILIEKNDARVEHVMPQAAAMHKVERVERVRQDAATDRISEKAKNKVVIAPVNPPVGEEIESGVE